MDMSYEKETERKQNSVTETFPFISMAAAQLVRDPLEMHNLLIAIFAHGYTV